MRQTKKIKVSLEGKNQYYRQGVLITSNQSESELIVIVYEEITFLMLDDIRNLEAGYPTICVSLIPGK